MRQIHSAQRQLAECPENDGHTITLANLIIITDSEQAGLLGGNHKA